MMFSFIHQTKENDTSFDGTKGNNLIELVLSMSHYNHRFCHSTTDNELSLRQRYYYHMLVLVLVLILLRIIITTVSAFIFYIACILIFALEFLIFVTRSFKCRYIGYICI